MLWFKNTSAIRLTNQNHAGKNANFNRFLRYVRLKKFFHCMLKKIDQVETSNQWVNNIPGAWSEKQDAVLLIVGLNKVFSNVISDRQIWHPWEIGVKTYLI